MTFGITMGDSSGVGPEILLKSAARKQIQVPFVVYGDLSVLERANEELGYGVRVRKAAGPDDVSDDSVSVIDHDLLSRHEITPGRLNAASGKAARAYVVSAAKDALSARIRAMITLPMNKEATQMSDPNFTGHTELIGEVCGSRDVTIMLASEKLIVTHVSTHCSLREAIERARKPRISRIIELTCEAVQRLKPEYKVAVAGLNPHAGENGLFGREEIEEIRPAVEWAQQKGYRVDGPHAPDTLFYAAVQRQKYDAVVCMYHDQGHIPSKLLDFEGGVNITLGLPIIRTSVDHGTAFDIAWKGMASNTSLLKAIAFAERLARVS
jgi:4-phospho-D-threonate 3-dehydrogenase / 4-phospho-D-erythronate 3-dehydrogenase